MNQNIKQNKTVIVTGGSRGSGEGIVRMLAEENYNMVLGYNQSGQKAEKIQKELQEKGKNIEIFKADVSKRKEVKELVQFTLERFGTIDVLINNAGIAQTKLFTDITDVDWQEMLQNNLTSVFYCTQETIPTMIHHKKGCIINISSIWGITGGSCEVHYSAAKAGIIGMTKALAKELGPSNIRVNCIAPGMIETDMNKEYTQEDKKQIKEETPLQKIGRPIDIAKCVKWLIEDEFTTGQVISPNGGWVI